MWQCLYLKASINFWHKELTRNIGCCPEELEQHLQGLRLVGFGTGGHSPGEALQQKEQHVEDPRTVVNSVQGVHQIQEAVWGVPRLLTEETQGRTPLTVVWGIPCIFPRKPSLSSGNTHISWGIPHISWGIRFLSTLLYTSVRFLIVQFTRDFDFILSCHYTRIYRVQTVCSPLIPGGHVIQWVRFAGLDRVRIVGRLWEASATNLTLVETSLIVVPDKITHVHVGQSGVHKHMWWGGLYSIQGKKLLKNKSYKMETINTRKMNFIWLNYQ